MRTSYSSFLTIIFILFFTHNLRVFPQTGSFDYKRYLFGTRPTLSLTVQSVNKSSGSVTLNGSDSQAPTTPFAWFWGDSLTSTGFFPQTHTYSDTKKNYFAKVIATYSSGSKDSVEVLVRFVSPGIAPISLSPDIAVTVPNSSLTLVSRQPGYGFSSTLSYFNDSFFIALPRASLEYVTSVAASIEKDFVNDDVFLINGKFQQVMLRDSAAGGAYSIWYSSPIAFGVGDAFLKESVGYSSLFHEMGHNITLNSPANYYYGGKIDGNANAIFSEMMAQIFQHAAGYEIINTYKMYGLSDDLMFDIRNSVNSSVVLVRTSYDRYVSSGNKFASWNNPGTTKDETFDTFMTIAYKFMEQAENTGQGYKNPLKRMMRLLQGFNPNWAQRYDRLSNTAAADTFRATLMATAVSFGFDKDLRPDFRSLNFPLSDEIYNELYNSVSSVEDRRSQPSSRFELGNNFPNPFNPSTSIPFTLIREGYVSLKIFNILGKEVETLIQGAMQPGLYEIEWSPRAPGGVYFYRLQAGGFFETKKIVFMK